MGRAKAGVPESKIHRFVAFKTGSSVFVRCVALFFSICGKDPVKGSGEKMRNWTLQKIPDPVTTYMGFIYDATLEHARAN
jgi:hypothetical protein